MNSNKNPTNKQFPGFDIPRQNWFKLPYNWTDLTAGMQSWAEQKIVEYVLRHTWGYQEYGGLKKITLDEFEKGRKRGDGSRVDRGGGVHRQAIISGIRQSVDDGFLIEETDDSDKGRVKKYYGLHMLPSLVGEEGYENHTPDVWQSHIRRVETTRRSEKETKERNLKIENTVNGIELLKKMPNNGDPEKKIDYVAGFLIEKLGDRKSEKFYRLVAAKLPEDTIRRYISEIEKDGGAKNPAKVFTNRVKLYAIGEMKKKIGSR